METRRFSLLQADLPARDIQKLAHLTKQVEILPPCQSLAPVIDAIGKKSFIDWVLIRRRAIRSVRSQIKVVSE